MDVVDVPIVVSKLYGIGYMTNKPTPRNLNIGSGEFPKVVQHRLDQVALIAVQSRGQYVHAEDDRQTQASFLGGEWKDGETRDEHDGQEAIARTEHCRCSTEIELRQVQIGSKDQLNQVGYT